jgi:carbon monoxide dehydrogenase subunit G
MQITSEFDVAETPDKVWEFFNNIPLVAACLPGADISDHVGEDRYAGTVAIGLGPVRLDFVGEAEIKERNAENRTIMVDAAGADVKGRGQAALVVNASLTPHQSGTRVLVHQDLQLSGAAAQYGRGLVQDVTAVLLDDFAANMRASLSALERGEDYVPGERSTASGFKIGLKAIWMALARVARRFFKPYRPANS